MPPWVLTCKPCHTKMYFLFDKLPFLFWWRPSRGLAAPHSTKDPLPRSIAYFPSPRTSGCWCRKGPRQLSSKKNFYYRKRGSASYIVREVLLVRERERYRERERDRRKWRHHCRAKIGDEFTLSLAKNSHNGDELTLSLAKNSHFSFLPSHFPSLPSRRGHHGGAEIRNECHTFYCQKFFRPQALFPLFQMAPAARRVIENPRQMIKYCPVLFCSSHRKTESN